MEETNGIAFGAFSPLSQMIPQDVHAYLQPLYLKGIIGRRPPMTTCPVINMINTTNFISHKGKTPLPVSRGGKQGKLYTRKDNLPKQRHFICWSFSVRRAIFFVFTGSFAAKGEGWRRLVHTLCGQDTEIPVTAKECLLGEDESGTQWARQAGRNRCHGMKQYDTKQKKARSPGGCAERAKKGGETTCP